MPPQAKTARQAARPRRIWKAPNSKASGQWFLLCLVLYLGIQIWYLIERITQPFIGPYAEPLRSFGIVAFVLVLITAAYTLRRRFLTGLGGKTQNWLWMHTWAGITSLLIALLHSNYAHILSDYCTNVNCLTQAAGGTAALLALAFLVGSGIIGRGIDVWQTRIIARDARSNGLGIVQSLATHLQELEFLVQRLCAGKSEQLKHYCLTALENRGKAGAPPSLPAQEQQDFQKVQETLATYRRLMQSQQRQQRAILTIRTWRIVHSILASIALIIIMYHAIVQIMAMF